MPFADVFAAGGAAAPGLLLLRSFLLPCLLLVLLQSPLAGAAAARLPLLCCCCCFDCPPVSAAVCCSELPSERDPTYMSQVEEAPRGVKEIMMGMGDRSGVFKDILALDEARAATAGRSRLGLLRRFEWKRVARTGGYFFPLALLSGVSARLITPAITTALGLAASYMCSTEGGKSSTSSVNRRTLGYTAVLLALHASAGAALAAYLFPAVRDANALSAVLNEKGSLKKSMWTPACLLLCVILHVLWKSCHYKLFLNILFPPLPSLSQLIYASTRLGLYTLLFVEISALPFAVGPDALVASSVILQWWLASLLYYTGPPKEAAAEEEEQQAAADQRGIDEGEGEGGGPDATDAEDDLRDTVEE